MGGMLFPAALTATPKVTRVPRSALVMPPTCLAPFLAKTFPDFCTVVTPEITKSLMKQST